MAGDLLNRFVVLVETVTFSVEFLGELPFEVALKHVDLPLAIQLVVASAFHHLPGRLLPVDLEPARLRRSGGHTRRASLVGKESHLSPILNAAHII